MKTKNTKEIAMIDRQLDRLEAVDLATLDTPAKWNSVCREAIWRNYDLMRPHTQLLFHDYFTMRYGAKN